MGKISEILLKSFFISSAYANSFAVPSCNDNTPVSFFGHKIWLHPTSSQGLTVSEQFLQGGILWIFLNGICGNSRFFTWTQKSLQTFQKVILMTEKVKTVIGFSVIRFLISRSPWLWLIVWRPSSVIKSRYLSSNPCTVLEYFFIKKKTSNLGT